MSEQSQVSKPVVVLETWKFVLSIVIYLIVAAISYATVKAQTEENANQIREMKSDYVPRGQYEEMRDDVRARLMRIEGKIDEEKKIRQLEDMYSSPRHR